MKWSERWLWDLHDALQALQAFQGDETQQLRKINEAIAFLHPYRGAASGAEVAVLPKTRYDFHGKNVLWQEKDSAGDAVSASGLRCDNYFSVTLFRCRAEGKN